MIFGKRQFLKFEVCTVHICMIYYLDLQMRNILTIY